MPNPQARPQCLSGWIQRSENKTIDFNFSKPILQPDWRKK
jgi:hypothetical protein